jgi:hypothetical protein
MPLIAEKSDLTKRLQGPNSPRCSRLALRGVAAGATNLHASRVLLAFAKAPARQAETRLRQMVFAYLTGRIDSVK